MLGLFEQFSLLRCHAKQVDGLVDAAVAEPSRADRDASVSLGCLVQFKVAALTEHLLFVLLHFFLDFLDLTPAQDISGRNLLNFSLANRTLVRDIVEPLKYAWFAEGMATIVKFSLIMELDVIQTNCASVRPLGRHLRDSFLVSQRGLLFRLCFRHNLTPAGLSDWIARVNSLCA